MAKMNLKSNGISSFSTGGGGFGGGRGFGTGANSGNGFSAY